MAARFAAAGWRLLGRNVRVGRSELDLVAVDPGPPAALVVVEVRSNRAPDFGPPEERVSRDKVRAVLRGALTMRAAGQLPDGTRLPRLPLRIDLVVVEFGPALGRDVRGTAVRHLRGILG